MLVLHRKDKNRGEIRIIINDLDRAALMVSGTQWVNINDLINEFNSDPDVNDLYLTAVHTGDLKDEKLTELFQKCKMGNIQPITQSLQSNNQQNEQPKTKVHSNGEEDDNDEEEEEITKEESLKAVLDDFDLTCPECNDKHKALVDYDGNVYPCPSCLKIDAYQKGKKEGYSEGFDAGYAAALKALQKLTQTDQKETQNGTESKENVRIIQ